MKKYLEYIKENNNYTKLEVDNIVKFRYIHIGKIYNLTGKILEIKRRNSFIDELYVDMYVFKNTLFLSKINMPLKTLKKKLIKKWENMEEYQEYLKTLKSNVLDPYGEENWEND